ncbi:four helix bundle protein [Candidatus Gracilibacteria bacterium]|nr:four helix bundle protein [Candidatus Gracilibacteria bacterium]
MNVETFEKLFIWKESKNLFVDLCNKFTDAEFKDYFYKNQLLKATLSVSNNIADGYEKGYGKELVKYLGIAKGSLGEVKSMLIVGNDLGYFVEDEYSKLMESLNKIVAGIISFIKSRTEKKEEIKSESTDSKYKLKSPPL